MHMVNLVTGVVLGAAVLAAVGLPAAHADSNSVSSCTINISAGGAQLVEQQILAELVGDASVKLCDGQKDDPIEIEDSFEAVAFAVAKATADATAACYATGRATFTVNGQGYAEFTARSILKFVTQLFLESEICSTCSASVQVVVESLQEAVANAIAESTVILEGSITDDGSFASATGIASGEDPSTTANASALATGDRIEASANGFAETVANVSVTGIANVIISAEADILSGCIIDAEVAVTDADNNTLAECVISTVGVLETFDDDFTQGITVDLTASICDTPDEDQVILAVEGVFRATATALADIVGTCRSTDPNSAACARGFAEVDAVATTTTTLITTIVGDLVNASCVLEECRGPVDPLDITAVFTLTSQALANALADGCTEGVGIVDFEAFAEAVNELVVRAMVEILLKPIQATSDCILSFQQNLDNPIEPPTVSPPDPPIVDPPTVIPDVLVPSPPGLPPPTITAVPSPDPPADDSACANACVQPFRRCAGGALSSVSPCCQPDDSEAFVCKRTGRTTSETAFCRPASDTFFRGATVPCTIAT